MQNTTLSSIVLLAGNSTRMGQLKQHVELAGQSFLHHIISRLKLQKTLERLIFVGQQTDVAARNEVEAADGIWVSNPKPEDGPLSSIRLALGKIQPSSAVLLWPVDHPMISAATVSQLIEIWQKKPDFITVPSDGQRRGHPGIYPAWCQRLFCEIPLEGGARKIMQLHPGRIQYLMTDDPWITRNLNTPESLQEATVYLAHQSKSAR
ncbi:MAG: nucleotidyltransferase family protein [Candidatus Riflebacteria bacterium]|nr:nucleotidyltransferase family protein [Candidatus Riflebacteria bacterium]